MYNCAIFQLFEAARIAFFGALRALKDTRFTLLASILSFWVIALPIGYFIGTYFQLQGVGMLVGDGAGCYLESCIVVVAV